MASALQALVLSAFVVCLVKGQLSQRDSDIMINLAAGVYDKVGPGCNRQYTKTVATYKTDTVIDKDLCDDLKTGGKARTSLTSGGCTKAEVDIIEKKACDLIIESYQNLAYLMIKQVRMVAKFSQNCQNKIKSGGPPPETWYDVEQLCLKVRKTDVIDFNKQCPGDEYGDLKDVVCGGGASNLVCGLLTIGMGLVAALFQNL